MRTALLDASALRRAASLAGIDLFIIIDILDVRATISSP